MNGSSNLRMLIQTSRRHGSFRRQPVRILTDSLPMTLAPVTDGEQSVVMFARQISRSVNKNHNQMAMFALLLGDPVIVSPPPRRYLQNTSELCSVVVVSQVLKVVTNQSKRNHRIAAQLANTTRRGDVANSASTLTLLAIAADPIVPFFTDLGAGAAHTFVPYMSVIEPRHLAGLAGPRRRTSRQNGRSSFRGR